MKRGLIKRRKIKCFAILMVILSMTVGMLQTAWAESYDPAKTGSITINLEDLGTNRENVVFELYKVGTPAVADNFVSWTLDESFSDTGVDLNVSTAEEQQAAIAALEQAAEASGIQPLQASTDANGSLTFSDLEQGMYLAVQPASVYGTVGSSLIPVPSIDVDEEGNTVGWLYDVTVQPKADPPSGDAGMIQVTKLLSTLDADGNEISMGTSTDVSYQVGLFLDEDATIPYGEDYIKEIPILGGESMGTATYTDLPDGTYYIFEIDQYGDPVVFDITVPDQDGNYWYCTLDGGSNMVAIDMDAGDTYGEVALNNVYENPPDGFYIEATLYLTKNVEKDGEIIETDDTFYAGIFTDENQEKTDIVKKLEQNGTVEMKLPLGGEDGTEPITYIVKETDANGRPVDKASFPFTVTGEGDVTVSQEKLDGYLTLTNSVKSDDEGGTATPTSRPSNGGSGARRTTYSGGTTSRTSVKTDDETPIGLWIAALAVAGGAIIVGTKRKVSKKK